MKKTMSLLGLFFAGLALLANPRTGILAATTADTEAAATTVVTTTSEATTTTEAADTGGTYSVIGSEEQSRYGAFQVEVFFEDGQIVSIETLQSPSDGKSQSINSRAIPTYEAAIIASQSADIDALSGATITWQNYTASVQSALDAAGYTS